MYMHVFVHVQYSTVHVHVIHIHVGYIVHCTCCVAVVGPHDQRCVYLPDQNTHTCPRMCMQGHTCTVHEYVYTMYCTCMYTYINTCMYTYINMPLNSNSICYVYTKSCTCTVHVHVYTCTLYVCIPLYSAGVLLKDLYEKGRGGCMERRVERTVLHVPFTCT